MASDRQRLEAAVRKAWTERCTVEGAVKLVVEEYRPASQSVWMNRLSTAVEIFGWFVIIGFAEHLLRVHAGWSWTETHILLGAILIALVAFLWWTGSKAEEERSS